MKTTIISALCLIPIIILVWACSLSAGVLPIGPTKIPFYTGNTCVAPFMMYWGTSKGPVNDLVTPERIELLRRIGCFADCDYQAWSLVEQEPGKWDFGMYKKNAEILHNAGLQYIFFAWVHFPPKWYLEHPDFVPYQCAEHGEKLMQLSPWAPNVWDIYRKFYSEQHKAMGDLVDWIRIATPSDYGEIGYPAAMTSWLVPQKHAHGGYWCGDPYARTDFRSEMKRKFKTLSALNKRWGTSFGSWDEVTYPELDREKGAELARESGKVTDRRRWLDFIDWYYEVWLRFVPKLTSLMREFYPENQMIVSVGYASEVTIFGNDYSAVPKMAKETGIAMQTPGNVPYYALKRVSTACHLYGAPYYTEPPGDVPPDAEIARVFHDVSNGVQVYFEYPQNLDRARTKLRVYKDHMTGAKPLVDVALFNGTIEHRLDGGKGNFPKKSYLLGEIGRDAFDYDVIDEYLIRDGALKNYRVLVYVQGSVTEDFALRRIASWVKNGGVLVTCDLGDVETVEGDSSIWKLLAVGSNDKPLPGFEHVSVAEKFDWEKVKSLCTRKVGKGLVIQVPVKSDETDKLIQVVERVAHHLADFGSGYRSAPLIDGVRDDIRSTLLPDRILYFNGTDKEIVKKVVFRQEDWTDRRPEKMEVELRLAPHSIEAVMLK